jgi:DNA adenine methylase
MANESPRPFIKWAGGKTQLLPEISKYYPPKGSINTYIEPFLGGGAVFFDSSEKIKPRSAVLCDTNLELIKTYKAVRDHVETVIDLLREHEALHSKEHFLSVRGLQGELTIQETAARFIYLNKTCFNGLYRVNRHGGFNVAFGDRPHPNIVNEDVLRKASLQLGMAAIPRIDFRSILDLARPGDFVYLDPPYHPLSKTSSFAAYTPEGFGEHDQRALSEVCRMLDEKGCMFLLSNSNTPLIRELYRDFNIREVLATRRINSKGCQRGPIGELLVMNNRLLEVCR